MSTDSTRVYYMGIYFDSIPLGGHHLGGGCRSTNHFGGGSLSSFSEPPFLEVVFKGKQEEPPVHGVPKPIWRPIHMSFFWCRHHHLFGAIWGRELLFVDISDCPTRDLVCTYSLVLQVTA